MTYQVGAQNEFIDSAAPLLAGNTFEILASDNTVLGTGTIPNPAFNAAANGQASLATQFDIGITTAGTAAKFRAYTTGGNYIEGTVGTTASADLNLGSTSFANGDTVRISTWDLVFPTS